MVVPADRCLIDSSLSYRRIAFYESQELRDLASVKLPKKLIAAVPIVW